MTEIGRERGVHGDDEFGSWTESTGPPGFTEVNRPSAGEMLGREEAFRRYVEPDIDVLLRVARTLTGSWTDAEDVVQEVLIRAWRAADRFDGAHPRAWLLTILRHTHLNTLRRRRPDLLADPANFERSRPAFGSTAEPTPEERVMDQTLSAPLEHAITALDPRFRTVLLLVDAHQLTYAEAAAVLDVPVGTVVSRLSRARDRVRRELRSRPPNEGIAR